MELRSYSHLHFIQAIGGGIVTKCLNVDYRGKPGLLFKQIRDIYESEDVKTHSFSTRKWTAEDDNIKVKVDRTCLPITNGQSIGSDYETCDFGNKGSHNERDGELNEDFSFSSMTLKQLKERCKTKKRKLSKFVDLTNEDIKTCSPVKQEYSDLLLEEDEFDLKEPLSCWKSRLTKNSKAKKRCMHEHISTFSQNSVVSPAKSTLILSDQGFPQSSRDLPTPVKVKLEVPEPGYPDSQDVAYNCFMIFPKQIEVGGTDHSVSESVVCVADDSFASWNEQAELHSSDYLESQGDANNLSVGCNEQVEVPAPDCSAMQSLVSAAHDLSLSSSENVGSCEILETDNESVSEASEARHSSIYIEEFQDCVVNKISYEYRQNDQPDSLSNVDPTIAEALVVDVPETTNSQALVLPVSKYKNERVIAYPLPQGIRLFTSSPTKEYNLTSTSAESEIKDEGFITQLLNRDISPQAVSPIKEHDSISLLSGTGFKNEEYVHLLAQDTSIQALSPTKEHSSDMCNSSQSYSSSSSNGVEAPDAANDTSPQCMEPSNGSMPPVFEDDHTASATIIPVSMCNSSLDNPHPCPTSCLAPEDDDLPATEVNRHLIFSGSDTAIHRSWSHSCETTDEGVISAVTKNRQHSELQHGPGKLLSTRKTISPTSQEKLCRAMNSIDLYDDLEPYKCKIKLRFTKLTKDRTSSASSDVEGDEVNIGPGRPAQGSKNEAVVISKQNIRKRKNDMKVFHPKGILKVPQVSRGPPHPSNACTSSQNYSQSAIAFSQRQMHDIECLATKLTRELKFMKDIVEEVTQSEGCLATSVRYSIDETGDQTAHVHGDMISDKPECKILVRAALENANKVEETTKRWLSMMTRDCNRFCKIMRLTESEPVASGNAIHTERKKITFADEAGGELCQVKLFYNSMASSETNGETEELLGK